MELHPTAQDPPTAADKAAEDAQYYLHFLHALLDIGANVARTVDAQAKAQLAAAAQPASTPPDLTIPFDRIARAIRRTITVARDIADPRPAAAGPDRKAARKRILREVEDVIQRKAEDAAADSLNAELRERLDAPDLDEEIDSRPVAEIIADICRDLGIAHPPGSHPWKRRTPADIAELCARAATLPPRRAEPRPVRPDGPTGIRAA